MAITAVLAALALRPEDSAAALLLAAAVLGIAALAAVLLAARPTSADLVVGVRIRIPRIRMPVRAADPGASGHVRARAPGVAR